jgi:hypothetical protein
VRDAEAIERAITTLASGTNGGLIVLPGALATRHRDLIIPLAARHRLPSISAGTVVTVDQRDRPRQVAFDLF